MLLNLGAGEALAHPDEGEECKFAVTPILFKGPNVHFTLFKISFASSFLYLELLPCTVSFSYPIN